MIDKDKVIQLAKEAGWTDIQLSMAAPAEIERLSRFYTAAFKAGMDRAAEICEAEQDRSEEARADARFKLALKEGDERNAVDRGQHWMTVSTCNAMLRNAAKVIRAHAKNQPESTHDTGNV